jgi:hypothetical protein
MHPVLDLRVDQQGERPLFSFSPRRTPKRPWTIMVAEIEIHKVTSGWPSCELKSPNSRFGTIRGSWRYGDVPPSYSVRGCKDRFTEGEYQIIIYAGPYEGRYRLDVDRNGGIRVLPWEDEQTIREAQEREEQMNEQWRNTHRDRDR